MDRLQKREIRKKICLLLNNCQGCEGTKTRSNDLCNACPVALEMQSLSAKLLEDEAPKSTQNGLKMGRWNDEEVLYLENHLNLFPLVHIAKRLNREEDTVLNKVIQLTHVKSHLNPTIMYG